MPKNFNLANCTQCKCISGLFKNLLPEELELMSTHRAEVKFRKGENLIKYGTLASHVMYIRQGLVKCYVEESDRDMIISINPKGDFIGLSSIFENSNFMYSVTAYEDTQACMFDVSIFKQIARSNAAFSAEIIRLQNVATNQLVTRMVCLTQRKLHGRLANLLLCLSKRIYQSKEFETSLSRKELSEIAIMTPESLSRVLADFRNDGILEVDGNKFSIKNPDKLKMLALKG